MGIFLRIIVIIVGALLVILGLGWIGLRIHPKPFPAFPQKTPALQTVPLPDGLPAPVERIYKKVYGD